MEADPDSSGTPRLRLAQLFLRCLLLVLLLGEPWASWGAERKKPTSKCPEDSSIQAEVTSEGQRFCFWFGAILCLMQFQTKRRNQTRRAKVVQGLPRTSSSVPLFCHPHHGVPFPRGLSLASSVMPALDTYNALMLILIL